MLLLLPVNTSEAMRPTLVLHQFTQWAICSWRPSHLLFQKRLPLCLCPPHLISFSSTLWHSLPLPWAPWWSVCTQFCLHRDTWANGSIGIQHKHHPYHIFRPSYPQDARGRYIIDLCFPIRLLTPWEHRFIYSTIIGHLLYARHCSKWNHSKYCSPVVKKTSKTTALVESVFPQDRKTVL